MFTQPLMYKKIKQQAPVMLSYAKKLIDCGIVSQDEFKVQYLFPSPFAMSNQSYQQFQISLFG